MDIRRELLPNIFTGILVVCAVIVTSLTVHQFIVNRSTSMPPTHHIDGWRKLLAGRKVSLGSEGAKIQIIEFSDYQCPYCRDLEKNLRTLVERKKADVSITRYDYPLTQIHSFAYKAAVASKCAESQGVVEPYQAELFSSNLADVDWTDLAKKAGVPDVTEFSSCLKESKTASLVDNDIKTADRLGVQQTPTLVVNGNVIPGMESLESLENLITSGD